jgi:hypothetical protein
MWLGVAASNAQRSPSISATTKVVAAFFNGEP